MSEHYENYTLCGLIQVIKILTAPVTAQQHGSTRQLFVHQQLDAVLQRELNAKNCKNAKYMSRPVFSG